MDAGILLVCTRIVGIDPLASRFVSFGTAVACTSPFNRVWAFRGRADPGVLKGLALYLGVQGLGFACNLGLYATLVLLAPLPWNTPLPWLAAASGLAMLVNYLGSRTVVFRGRRA